MKLLKKPISITYLFLTLSLCFILISCEKEKIEPELVPITTSGKNNMGFYVNGMAVNTEGEWSWGIPTGVSGWINEEGLTNVFATGNDPEFAITIYFHKDSLDDSNRLVINQLINQYEEISYRDERGITYDSLLQGEILISRIDDQVLAGTFEFEAIHKDRGLTIQVTDGRFDIKLNEE